MRALGLQDHVDEVLHETVRRRGGIGLHFLAVALDVNRWQFIVFLGNAQEVDFELLAVLTRID